jgi:membrane associated rhomboid family serine protease
MKFKNLIWYVLTAIVTFIVMGIFKGNFDWFDWTNIIPALGGLIGVAIATYKDRTNNQADNFN